MIIIFKNQQFKFNVMPLYRSSAVITSTQVWLNSVPKFDIWNLCVIRLLYYTSAHNTFHIILKCNVECQNFIQYTIKAGHDWHLKNDHHSRMIEIIGICNHAFNEPIAGHQLNICEKMRFQTCTYLTIKELIFPWARCWSVSHDDQKWITLRSEALSNVGSCHLPVFHTL